MRKPLRWLALGLIALWGPALASAADGKATGPEAATCNTYGTRVEFEKSPTAAATRAAKEEKLVLVLHISGLFEDPDFT
jgi:hypothetical protein